MSEPPLSDSKIRSVIEDLEASLAHFDERLGSALTPTPPPASFHRKEAAFPEINPEAARQPLPAEATAARRPETPARPVRRTPPPAESSDLLGELAKAAERSTTDTTRLQSRRLELAQRYDAALRPVFDYFNALCKHVNVLRPTLPFVFALTARDRFGPMLWETSRADFRTTSIADQPFVLNVSLRATLKGAPLSISTPRHRAEAVRREILLVSLKLLEDIPVTPQGGQELTLVVSGEIPVQLSFAADLERQRVILRCRNFMSLGLAAYAIAPEHFNRSLLDALGRCLIGQSPRLPHTLQPLPFNQPDSV